MDYLALILLLISVTAVAGEGNMTLEEFFEKDLHKVAVGAGGGGLLLIIIVIILAVCLCKRRRATQATSSKKDPEMVMGSTKVDAEDDIANHNVSNEQIASTKRKKSQRPHDNRDYSDIDLYPETFTKDATNISSAPPQTNGTGVISTASTKQKSQRPPASDAYTDIDLPFATPTKDSPIAISNQEGMANEEVTRAKSENQPNVNSTSANSRLSEIDENAQYAPIMKPKVAMVDNDLYGTG